MFEHGIRELGHLFFLLFHMLIVPLLNFTVQALFSQNTLSDCYFLFLKLTKSRKSINTTLLKEHIEGNLTCMENQPPEGISLPF